MRHTSPEEFEPDEDRNLFDSWSDSSEDSFREFADDAAPPEPSEKVWSSIQSAISQRCDDEKNRRSRLRFRRNAALLTLAAASLFLGIATAPNNADRQTTRGVAESADSSEPLAELAPDPKHVTETLAAISDRTSEPDMIALTEAEDYEIESVRGGEPVWVVGSTESIPETIALAGIEDLRILNYHPIVAETPRENVESRHPHETNAVVPLTTNPAQGSLHPGFSATHGIQTTFAGDKPLFFGDRPPHK